MEETAQVGEQGQAIRILLVDDHRVMRAGTRRILEDEADVLVVGEADDGAEALGMIEECAPDIVLLDIEMPRLDGVKTCEALNRDWPAVRVLALTGHLTNALIRRMYRFGAAGYVLKSAGPQELLGAIRLVAAGQLAYAPEMIEALAHPQKETQLTPREIQTLRALARGLKNSEIAEELFVSVNTVEFHLRNLFIKLGATSRADALMRANRVGWLDSQEPLC